MDSGRAAVESSDLPTLSVVVPTYNEEDRIETCLRIDPGGRR